MRTGDLVNYYVALIKKRTAKNKKSKSLKKRLRQVLRR